METSGISLDPSQECLLPFPSANHFTSATLLAVPVRLLIIAIFFSSLEEELLELRTSEGEIPSELSQDWFRDQLTQIQGRASMDPGAETREAGICGDQNDWGPHRTSLACQICQGTGFQEPPPPRYAKVLTLMGGLFQDGKKRDLPKVT